MEVEIFVNPKRGFYSFHLGSLIAMQFW